MSFKLPSRCPDFEAGADYKAAVGWYDQFTPDTNRDYSAAAAYAEADYNNAETTYDALDRKAEWTFGLAAAGAGLLLTIVKDFQISGAWLLPAMGFFIASMITSLLCRTPQAAPVPLSAKDALELAKKPDELVGTIAASRYCAAVGLRHLINWKADQVRFAAWLLIASVVSAAMAVVAASWVAPPPPAVSSASASACRCSVVEPSVPTSTAGDQPATDNASATDN